MKWDMLPLWNVVVSLIGNCVWELILMLAANEDNLRFEAYQKLDALIRSQRDYIIM